MLLRKWVNNVPVYSKKRVFYVCVCWGGGGTVFSGQMELVYLFVSRFQKKKILTVPSSLLPPAITLPVAFRLSRVFFSFFLLYSFPSFTSIFSFMLTFYPPSPEKHQRFMQYKHRPGGRRGAFLSRAPIPPGSSRSQSCPRKRE